MKSGIHLIERQRVLSYKTQGVDVPAPWLGIVDLLRTIEGHLPEPDPRRALGVIGLDRLFVAGAANLESVLASLRGLLYSGMQYFEWKEIPLVFLLDGQLGGEFDTDGAQLVFRETRFGLNALFGRGMKPMTADTPGWWWGPKLG